MSICEAKRALTGAICELEYPHTGKPHRLGNCDARKVQEWNDDDIAPSSWNQPLTFEIVKKAA